MRCSFYLIASSLVHGFVHQSPQMPIKVNWMQQNMAPCVLSSKFRPQIRASQKSLKLLTWHLNFTMRPESKAKIVNPFFVLVTKTTSFIYSPGLTINIIKPNASDHSSHGLPVLVVSFFFFGCTSFLKELLWAVDPWGYVTDNMNRLRMFTLSVGAYQIGDTASYVDSSLLFLHCR